MSFTPNSVKDFSATTKILIMLGVVLILVLLYTGLRVFGSATLGLTLFTNPYLEDGLIAHYTFDTDYLDTSSSTAEILDRSGNGYNANWLNHGTTTGPGVLGQAIKFDGVDDYIDAGDLGADVRTVAFWVKTDSSSANIIKLNGEASGGGGACGYGSDIGGGECRGYITSGSTWSVPSDWDSSNNTIEAIGAGGDSGLSISNTSAGAGGGGGEYRASSNVSLTPGSTVDINIPAGGDGSGADGAWVKNGAGGGGSIVVEAKNGGNGSGATAGAGGTGGTGAAANYDGGSGGSGGTDGSAAAGGGGGGSAGPSGVGKDGDNGASATGIGGGGGGGSNGGSSTAGGNATGVTGAAGGHGNGGTGGGSAGADQSPGGNATAGTGGGGGGAGRTTGSTDAPGGDGAAESLWDTNVGPSGGGGAGGSAGGGGATGDKDGGNGGTYGGGAGGCGFSGTIDTGECDGSTGGQGIIVITYTPSAGTNGATSIQIDSGVASTSAVASPTYYVNGVATSTVPADSGWHHVVVTTPTAIDATSTTIGKIGSYLNGSMDDVRFYNRELSSEEVKRLYQLGATSHISTTITRNEILENGLVGHWTFDGSVTTPGRARSRVNTGTTTDGLLIDMNNWTANNSADDGSDWRGVTYGKGIFVAVADVGTNRIMTSSDGENWTTQTQPVTSNWRGVVYAEDKFVAVADAGTDKGMTSSDGVTWTENTPASGAYRDITHGNGTFVAVGPSSVMNSPDGETWTIRTSPEGNAWESVAYGNGTFVAVASNGTSRVMYSTDDGNTWSLASSTEDNSWKAVTFGNGTFVAVSCGYNISTQGCNSTAGGNRVMTSTDGISWTAHSVADLGWSTLTYNEELFVSTALADTTGAVMVSYDGATWTPYDLSVGREWNDITYGRGRFVAVADSGASNRTMVTPVPAEHSPGVLGQSLEFNGTDDYVSVPDDTAIRPSGAFTVSAWIYKESLGARGTILAKRYTGLYDSYLLSVLATTGEVRFCIEPSPNDVCLDVGEITPGEWTHVAGTYDGSDVMKVYINGEPESTTASQVNANLFGAYDLLIGAEDQNGTLGNFFDGKIDDVRIYDRAVSDEEMLRLYQLGATTHIAKTLKTIDPIEQDLIAHWTFDGPTIDSSSTTAEIRDASDNPILYGDWLNATNDRKPGKLGQAIFLSSGGANDSIRIASSTALNLGTEDFSWSFWYNSTNPTNQQAIMGTRGGGAAIGLHIRINSTAGKLDTYICDDCSGSGQTVTYSDSSDYDEPGWHHVVATFDRDGNVTYYHNGVEDGGGSITGQQGSITDDSDPLYIGATGSSGSTYTQFYGLLDDIRVYRRVLNQEDVIRLYELGGG